MNRRYRRRNLLPAEFRIEAVEPRVLLSGQNIFANLEDGSVLNPGQTFFLFGSDKDVLDVEVYEETAGQSILVESATDVLTGYQTDTALQEGEYRVRTRNSSGGEWTQTCFSVAFAAPPAITSPGAEEFSQALQVTWSAVDGAQSYQLELFEVRGSDQVKAYNSDETSLTIATEDLTPGTVYGLRVRAVASDGDVTLWGTPVQPLHYIGNGLRKPVELTTSVDNDLAANVHWRQSFSTATRTTVFELYINRVGDRSNAVFNERISTTAAESDVPIGQLENGNYEVWGRQFFDDGTRTRWGSPTSLTISDSDVDATPAILSPNTPFGTDVTDVRPEFTWTESVLDESYEIWLAPHDDITNAYLNVTGITQTSFTPSEDLPVDVYRLQVRARLSNGDTTAWSDARIFAVHPHGLHPITVTGGVGDQQDTTPTIEWQTVGNVTEGYEVFVSRLSDPQTPVYQRKGIDGSSHEIETALGEGTYNLWVRATYNHLHIGLPTSRWGNAYELTIGAASGGDSTDAVPVSSVDTSDLTPVIVWEARSNVDRYEMWINVKGERRVAIYHEVNLQGSQHEVTKELFDNSEYEVWVRAHYGDGTKTNWGAATEFVLGDTNADPLAPIQVTAGLDDPTDGTPELVWENRPGVSSYELYINPVGDRQNEVYREWVHDGSSHIVTDLLEDNTSYEIWVRGSGQAGATRWGSAPAVFTTTTLVPDFDQTVPEVTQAGGVISWETIDEATRYRVVIEEIVASVDLGTRSFVVHDDFVTGTSMPALESGQYTVTLHGENSEGHATQWSSLLTFVVDFESNEPALQVTAATASWNAIPGATSYKLWVNEYDNAGGLVRARAVLLDTAETSATLELTPGIYRGWLQATSASGEKTGWSEAVDFTIGGA